VVVENVEYTENGDDGGDVSVFVGVDAEDDLLVIRVGLAAVTGVCHAGHGRSSF
jgi:hypothetical protein